MIPFPTRIPFVNHSPASTQGGCDALIQVLESRKLLSSSISNGLLTVNGTSGNDVLALRVEGAGVAVYENYSRTATYSGVTSIRVNGFDGRDRITIETNITVPTRLDGGNQADTLTGGHGGDVLLGGGGHDALYGRGGVDALLGGSGNDLLDGGTRNDYLDGQSGHDTATYVHHTAPIVAHLRWLAPENMEFPGSPFIVGNGGATGEQDSYANIDVLLGTRFADRLEARVDASLGQTPQSPYPMLLDGGGGNDTLNVDGWGFEFEATLRGGAGDDRFTFAGGTTAHFEGGAGDDSVLVTAQSDGSISSFVGGDGYDRQVLTEAGSGFPASNFYLENLIPGGFEEVFDASGGNSGVFGLTADNDTVKIVAQDMEVHAGNGNDRVTIEGANMTLDGGTGDDVLFGSSVADDLIGGPGRDALFGRGGGDALWGGLDNDYLEGGDGADWMHGDDGHDTLNGGKGIDYFEGGLGDDVFFAREGFKDFLYGGSGTDSAQRDDSEEVISSIENRLP